MRGQAHTLARACNVVQHELARPRETAAENRAAKRVDRETPRERVATTERRSDRKTLVTPSLPQR
jgi:hypothetical protein